MDFLVLLFSFSFYFLGNGVESWLLLLRKVTPKSAIQWRFHLYVTYEMLTRCNPCQITRLSSTTDIFLNIYDVSSR